MVCFLVLILNRNKLYFLYSESKLIKESEALLNQYYDEKIKKHLSDYFKENFEMFYDYEWALRVVYNGGIIRSIPKATHFHAMVDDGAFETQKALPSETVENWLGAAKREYFFEVDREINFD